MRRKPGSNVIVLMILMVFWLLPIAPIAHAADNSAVPVLSTEPSGNAQPTQQIEATLEVDQVNGRIPLYILYSSPDGQPLNGVTIFAQVRTQRDLTATPIDITLVDADTDAPLNNISVPVKPDVLRAELRINNLTAFGDFWVDVLMRRPEGSGASALQPILPAVHLTHTADPVLQISQADQQGQVSLSTDGPHLVESIYLRETAGHEAKEKLLIAADTLEDAEGHNLDVTLTPSSTETIASHMGQLITVRGDVTALGVYKGRLTLSWGNHQDVYTLLVTRSPATQQFALSVIAPGQQYRNFWWDSVNIAVPLRLTETTGRPGVTNPPQLMDLKSVTDPQTNTTGGASYQKTTLDLEETGSLSLAAHETRPIQMVILGVKDVGMYQANITSTSEAGAESIADFRVSVGYNLYVPAILILVGLFVSVILRYIITVTRPQIVNRIAISRAATKVKDQLPGTGAQDTNIRRGLLNELMDVQDEIISGATVALTTELDKVKKQLNNYISVRSLIALPRDFLEWQLNNETADIRKQFTAKLVNFQVAFQSDALGALADDALVDDAKAVRTKLATNGVDFSQAIRDLLTQIEQVLTTIPEATADFTLKRYRDDLLTQRTALEGVLDRTPTASADYTSPEYRSYDDARRRFQRDQAGIFRYTLGQTTKPPTYSTPKEWDILKHDVLGKLTANPTPDTYAAALTYYLTQVLDKLDVSIKAKATDPKVAKEQLQTIRDTADNARSWIDSGDYRSAMDSYNMALDGYKQLWPPASVVRPSARVGAVQEVLAGAALRSAARTETSTREKEISFDSLKTLQKKMLVFDIFSYVVLGIISLLVGLELLWAGKVWGSFTDIVAAVLWGFGVTAVGKSILLPTSLVGFDLSTLITDAPK